MSELQPRREIQSKIGKSGLFWHAHTTAGAAIVGENGSGLLALTRRGIERKVARRHSRLQKQREACARQEIISG